MNLNADFTARAAVHAARLPWVPSPIQGVERRMLDRIGGEVARATSIVRYAPGSRFAPHTHGGGEEFLVLEGTFQDEHGDFPAGTYVRNPPTSRHTPGAAEGCTIFVKLWQFDPNDRTQLALNTATAPFTDLPHRPGIQSTTLFQDANEHVTLEIWPAGAAITLPAPAGLELLVLAGAFTTAGETFAPQSWLRLPPGETLQAHAAPQGCQIWLKTGHLLNMPPAPPQI
jgi:anti-sigma factor ChrR (cupin superfamily)